MATATTLNTNNLGSITRYEDVKAAAAKTPISDAMGKTEFLTLFTAQLKNQNPLDPVKNEAFVAQLAQFSQLEATTNMSNSLSSLVSSLQGDRMMAGAGLVGRSVAAPNIPVKVTNGQPVTSVVELPDGADSVQIQYFDSLGRSVRTVTTAAQQPGQTTIAWDALDDAGQAVADGTYKVVATATRAGQKTNPSVSTYGFVQAARIDPSTKEIYLDFDGGASAPLSSVVRVGG